MHWRRRPTGRRRGWRQPAAGGREEGGVCLPLRGPLPMLEPDSMALVRLGRRTGLLLATAVAAGALALAAAACGGGPSTEGSGIEVTFLEPTVTAAAPVAATADATAATTPATPRAPVR